MKVLTGDVELVTQKVCREVDFEVRKVYLGAEIEEMDEGQLAAAVREANVFARLTPAHKERIVRSLRAQGCTVGFMGDGINDAPALRAADVGISVDSAVDISKGPPTSSLLEKNLMVLEEGVIQGRRTFNNMLKYIRMTASSNFGNVFSVLVASAFLPFLPMLPLQLLVQNLLYDISQITIPFDNVDEELLKQLSNGIPRAWDGSWVFFGPISSIFDIATYALMWYVFQASARNTRRSSSQAGSWRACCRETLVVHTDPHAQDSLPAKPRRVVADGNDADGRDPPGCCCLSRRWPSTSSCRRCRGATSRGWPASCWATAFSRSC